MDTPDTLLLSTPERLRALAAWLESEHEADIAAAAYRAADALEESAEPVMEPRDV